MADLNPNIYNYIKYKWSKTPVKFFRKDNKNTTQLFASTRKSLQM